MVDVVLQVLNELKVWVVCHDYMLCAVEGRDERRQSSSGTQFKDRLVLDKSAAVVFEVIRQCPPGIPEKVALG